MTERRYVLLPREGLLASGGPAFDLLVNAPVVRSTGPPQMARIDVAAGASVRVLDTVAENGPKLVELDDDAAAMVNRRESPLRAVPVVEYGRPNPPPRPLGGVTAALAAGVTGLSVTCTDAATGAGIPDVRVIAFTNFAQRAGDEGRTDASGTVSLSLPSGPIERLYAYPPAGHWGAFRQTLPAAVAVTLPLTPVDLSFVDCVRHYYANSQFDATAGVQVGVVDTGVGPHAGLNLVGGRNTVTGETATDYADSDIHGTHVAGLVGASGTPPTGLRGLAPGVALHSYRVFPDGGGGATNYAILKALILAGQDGCDIVNLSLGGGPHDDIVEEAILDARNQGMLVVVAAGNGGRQAVNFPGAYAGATAVTAMGREGTFPAGSLEEADVLRPPNSASNPLEFIAAFSDIGPQVAATGPGVGALSTLPGNVFGPLSGTSMAAPVVSGAAACLLSRDRVTWSMARTRARSDAIERLVQSNCILRRFGANFEGYGLPDPASV